MSTSDTPEPTQQPAPSEPAWGAPGAWSTAPAAPSGPMLPPPASAPAQPGYEVPGAYGQATPGPYAAPPTYGTTPYPGAYPPPAGYPGYSPYPPGPRTNVLAIVSLVCSLAGFATGFSAIAGIVCGHIALNQIKQSGEQGRGMAIAGIAVGYALVGLGILLLLGWVALMIGLTTLAPYEYRT